jgi:hypothetical protein
MISFYDLTFSANTFSVDNPKVAIATFAQIINLITSEVNKKNVLRWTFMDLYFLLHQAKSIYSTMQI